jgi:hypothetical protein
VHQGIRPIFKRPVIHPSLQMIPEEVLAQDVVGENAFVYTLDSTVTEYLLSNQSRDAIWKSRHVLTAKGWLASANTVKLIFRHCVCCERGFWLSKKGYVPSSNKIPPLRR